MSATPEAMPNVVERPSQQSSATPPQPPGQPLRLTLIPAAAAKQITPWLAKGVAIRKHLLRDLTDLDKARAQKKAWVAAYTDLQMKLFDGPTVGEACNDWGGRLLPEYAPLGPVIEQFYKEMAHRLRRLQAVVDHLEHMAVEDAPAAGAGTDQPADPAAHPGGAAAAKKDEPRGSKSLNWARLFPTAEELAGRSTEDKTHMPTATMTNPAAALVGKPQAADAKAGHAASGALPPAVKPVGLLLVHSADEAKAVCESLADLAVTPRVLALADAKPGDPEALLAGATSPAFALVWPHQGDAHGGWQLPLAWTLKRAGVAVDLNRLC